MAIKKIVALLGAFSVSACALVNTSLPKMVIDRIEITKEEQQYNSLGGVKNITDWFGLVPSVISFDVDKNNSIDVNEYYAYTKNVRAVLQWGSGWISEADEDASGYVTEGEWAKQLATVRVNGDWLKVFDTDLDGKVSIEEELVGIKYIGDVEKYYRSVVTSTATSWSKTLDVDHIQLKYDTDKSWSIDSDELTKYLNDNSKTFMFYYDWNGDGELTGVEIKTANEVIRGAFNEINQYLAALKAQYYSEFI